MKQAYVLVALVTAGVGVVVHAAEPPAAENQEAAPAQQGFGRGRGRGQWDDPRFIEDRKWFHFLLDNRDKIRRTITRTDKGVRLVEASNDPYVASLIQAHADVVSQFIDNGHAEVQKNHAVPPRPE
jgi:hypothetical protein